MKRFTCLSTLLLFLALAGCKKDNATNPDAASGIKVGSKWVYKYTQFNSSGAVLGTSNIELVVTSEQTIGGEKWWVLNATGSTTPELLRKATNGYITYKNNMAQLQFKIPAAVNDTWRVTFSSAAGDYSDFKVISTSQSVTVPGGTFSTYYAEGYDSNSIEDKVWYDEAHVMIKQQEYDEGPGSVMYIDHQLEFVSFTP
jgi:hypothetical protein